MVGDNTTAGGSSSPPRLSDTPLELPREDQVFNKEQCLFCNKLNGSLEANVAHMQTAHSLFIADRERLAVDLETLLAYLHLVIVGYNECICCGTQRNTTQAVQQHMLGKGHCRFDIESSDSEYADFYNLSESEAGSEEGDDEDDTTAFAKRKGQNPSVQDDEGSLRLPSGRIVSNRSQPQRSSRRRPLRSSSPGDIQRLDGVESTSDKRNDQAAPPSSSESTAATQPGTSGLAVTRAERREDKFNKQLATLRASDVGALAHLSSSEQRAVLATQQKQLEKAARVEQRYRTRLEGLGNKFLMGHFVKDAADKRTLWK
ncbi:hypothetical protein MAPG_10181 [Magnaporthiopsis poae ATCC 64411]|uniref:ZN622/Rei1/Reh1 zinc finger C2H2-type domain-containing protein n=1 Tax=Magnaporthiopsis poae (strain ATCC 64411 / 73-15) TaxID=644358 RepID=A0A0C4EBW9_MAGP6|nr:hypothetical protein MAPG_10181 [Magnaporthiopsis poae ATCC 64411]